MNQTAASIEKAYNSKTLEEFVDWMWVERRNIERQKNAWNLIRYHHRRGHVRLPDPLKPTTTILDDIKAALIQSFGPLAIVLLFAAMYAVTP